MKTFEKNLDIYYKETNKTIKTNMKTINLTYGVLTQGTPCHQHMGTCPCGRPMHSLEVCSFNYML